MNILLLSLFILAVATIINMVSLGKSMQKTKLLEQNITNLQSAEFYFRTRLSNLEQDVHDCTTIVNKPKRKPGRPRKSKAIVHELGN
jgi:hypothetical protein